ncbi:hypothetical protein CR164_07505 [Prosthecochloris marina]|uniref:Nucleotidyl transferase AbiEii/AbiGii toxin family protein n=1 Tax=Prosthecochloris marina TaxID=2017681 RepID=A0A317T7C1_9CHLB|nr:nucleotidyl transferase AbiEii/AbiGii toxin family protein [Prosthecochloris marina]PWW82170.1 hypothetical protein CR164_07505 [Prosthecochloris marina]
MTAKPIRNIGASVRRRLLNKAREEKRGLQELMQYYAMERFLYRLSVSPYADQFVLKGALLLRVWQTPLARPTMDIDMLGRLSNDEQSIQGVIRQILAEHCDDGIDFDPASISVEPITEGAENKGQRVKFRGELDAARIIIQIDLGFGDRVYPDPSRQRLPSLLDFPEAELYCYTRESVIAEKFEAMIKHGVLNSRMKDFYDIWMLSRQYDFQGKSLCDAMRQTLEQRRTELVLPVVAFSSDFIAAKQVQWKAFRKRLPNESVPEMFDEVVQQLQVFLAPVVEAIGVKKRFVDIWIAPDSWQKSHE